MASPSALPYSGFPAMVHWEVSMGMAGMLRGEVTLEKILWKSQFINLTILPSRFRLSGKMCLAMCWKAWRWRGISPGS